MHDYEEPLDPGKRPRDPAISAAVERLQVFFEQSPRRLFYSTQIETTLERDFFHWITGKALLELSERGRIRRSPAVVQEKTINFYAHLRHRYWRRQQRDIVALLDRIFDPEFAHAVGRHGELMFDAALGRNGFRAEAANTRSWRGRTWERTSHNLDRIVTRDGHAYGVEIKNTQNYISREELYTKIDICRHLEITPLFIMRFAPKSYTYTVYRNGGFALLFEEQMYPMGHNALVREVRERLGLKVHSPNEVREGDMQRLLNWHEARLRRT
jgi:hypothetical protein